ncbi:lysosomal cobalamin transport escort protein LMBD1 isoform X4 [Neoarius graeffei]|uniref:lysosomal cobalamin transport escort protein LMBD1 isoform X4 n=1 Tax=Neoarius graeffei TaxID=443677 RepID=UPI00298C84B5|nr:lysosomal cobalamin transport escort protein LMBD1 isoform X4 [Neoarius graeffei]
MKMAASTILLTETVLGWSIFAIVLLVILAFCWFYIRNYQSRQESEVISTITAICALAIALITSALLPVDIFLVSFMKYQNGTYKDWAASNETRSQIEDTILYGYYTLYAIILFCVFFWIPFVYFYYEEKDENISKCSQAKNAVKYTVVFVTICAALLLIGAFAPLLPPPKQNSTQWDKLQYLFKELGSSNGVVALSFSISSLTLIGMLAVITYTAYGMSVLPLNLIKGPRSVLYERLENTEDMGEVEQQIEKLKAKSEHGRPLSLKDRRNLQDLEAKLLMLRRRGHHLENADRNCCTKVSKVLRPFKVFPLDYVLITVITMYFVFTSMAGIRNMGIWFFWIRLYKIRPQRTRPQALLFLCMILLLIVLHTNHMIYSLAPQYVMYGSQKYLWQENHTSAATMKTCHADAPDDQCTVTRSYLFLHKFWFFSTIYYFGNWAFLAVFLIGMMVSCCRGKKSVIEGEVEEDDSDCSDDEYMH